jgi:hypothetical protein
MNWKGFGRKQSSCDLIKVLSRDLPGGADMKIGVLHKIRTKHLANTSYKPICTGSHGVMTVTMNSTILEHVTPCILLAVYLTVFFPIMNVEEKRSSATSTNPYQTIRDHILGSSKPNLEMYRSCYVYHVLIIVA